MTDKELRKLSRLELLEILVDLSNENAELTQMVEDLNKKLESKEIMLEEAGSIAEVAIRVNDVFATAQAAADQYLDNIKRLNDSQKAISEEIENESRKKAEEMLKQTEAICKKRIEETEAECLRKIQQTNNKCLKKKQKKNQRKK